MDHNNYIEMLMNPTNELASLVSKQNTITPVTHTWEVLCK